MALCGCCLCIRQLCRHRLTFTYLPSSPCTRFSVTASDVARSSIFAAQRREGVTERSRAMIQMGCMWQAAS